MPRIKRWFPVSHDINHSPTMRELAREFGLAGWRIWLEILSISDRVGQDIDCTSEGAVSRITSAAQTQQRITLVVTKWLLSHNCIATIDEQRCITRIVNYWDFHRTPEQKPLPPDLPDLPDRTIKNQDPATPAPSADPPKRKELDPRIKAPADRIYKSNPLKFQRLIQWIKQAEKYRYPAPVIAETLERFEARAGDVANWYGYLDKMIEKIKGDYNRDQSVHEHERHKAELREAVKRA